MLRTTSLLFALIPALALGFSACYGGTTTEDPENVGESEAAMIPVNPGLIGTFRSTALTPGSLSVLALKTDGTYHRGFTLERESTLPRGDEGRYYTWVNGRTPMLTVYPFTGGEQRYQYALVGDTLRIAKAADTSTSGTSTSWMILLRTDGQAWCNVPTDCTLQSLPVGICGSRWYCTSNVCDYPCREPYPTE